VSSVRVWNVGVQCTVDGERETLESRLGRRS
jgi:hypothetical protein